MTASLKQIHDFEVFKRSFVSKSASAVAETHFLTFSAMLGTFHD